MSKTESRKFQYLYETSCAYSSEHLNPKTMEHVQY